MKSGSRSVHETLGAPNERWSLDSVSNHDPRLVLKVTSRLRLWPLSMNFPGLFRIGPLALGIISTVGCTLTRASNISAGPLGAAEASRVEVDLSHHFRPFGAEGAFILFDPVAGRLTIHNEERARQRFLPASAFKILNSLIALETGVLADEREVIPWDGIDRGDWWNGDMDMRKAFQRSAVWFYQEVARRVGEERMQEWVRKVGYGNGDIRGGIDRFWLEGSLHISPEEQVRFLRRLHDGSLPFSERSETIVRDVMRMEETDEYVLRGKTGWARADGVNYGWLVGWVERGGRPYFFATQIESAQADFPMRRAQQEITRGALQDLGVLPPRTLGR